LTSTKDGYQPFVMNFDAIALGGEAFLGC